MIENSCLASEYIVDCVKRKNGKGEAFGHVSVWIFHVVCLSSVVLFSLLYSYRQLCQSLYSLIPKELGISFRVYPIEENGEKIENLVENDLAVEFHVFALVSVVSCMPLLYRYRLICQPLYSLFLK